MINKKLVNVKIIFTYLFLLSFFCFLLSFCSTQPQSGSLSGTVQLQGETDHSGITVALYELAELNPDIVAINQEYDFIGVIS